MQPNKTVRDWYKYVPSEYSTTKSNIDFRAKVAETCPVMLIHRIWIIAAFTACLTLTAKAQNIVSQWNDFLVETVRRTSTNPPLATRALAMTHTAMFDAWAAYDTQAVGTRLGATLRRPPTEHTVGNKETAISFAAYRVMSDLYPTQKEAIDAFMRGLGLNPADDTRDPANPAGIGNRAAIALLEFRHKDGSNQLGDVSPGAYSDYTGYRPTNSVDVIVDPNRWQPLVTPSGQPQNWLLPHWGLVTGFALKSGAQFRPGPPPFYGNSLYHERCDDLLRMSARLSDRDKMIAEYWEDGAGTATPPGHWNQIASFISRRAGHNLDRDVKLFFALTNAQFDAGIAIWEAKRFYDYIRPISAIRKIHAGELIRAWAGPGRGTQFIFGERWLPYLATPPFGEYTSGHTGFSAASADILMRFMGTDDYNASVTFGPGSSRIESGVTPKQRTVLSWATFSEAADQAGLSRRLGGIHFEDADIRSRIMGRQVAMQVWEKAQSHWDGTAKSVD